VALSIARAGALEIPFFIASLCISAWPSELSEKKPAACYQLRGAIASMWPGRPDRIGIKILV
jgi:hypothetical protein